MAWSGSTRRSAAGERVLRIFPNEASALRLIGALLVEQHEVWSTGKRYFDMTEYLEWKTTQTQEASQEIRQVSCTAVEMPGKRFYSTF